jgi:hypothetical protein
VKCGPSGPGVYRHRERYDEKSAVGRKVARYENLGDRTRYVSPKETRIIHV